MKKLLIFLMLSLPVFMVSCDKFLGNVPRGVFIPQYYDDYAMLLRGGGITQEPDMYKCFFLSDNAYMTNDAVVTPFILFDNADEVLRNIYTFQPGAVYPSGEMDRYWNQAYKNIYNCNVVINNIYKVPDATQQDKDALWASAAISRAYLYFKLVNYYAPHYDKNTAAEDYGVPMVLSEDIGKSYSMKSVQDIYDLILEDTRKALPFLPEKPRNVYHPSQAAAYGFLSKVYLYMGEYELALQQVEKALELSTAKMLDMNGYTIDFYNPFDRLKDADGVSYPLNMDCPEVIWAKDIPNLAACFFFSPEFYDLFSKDLPDGAADFRANLFAKDKAWFYQDFIFPGKVFYMGGNNLSGGVTLPDLLLTKAELKIRVEGASGIREAMACLDQIRNYRIKDNEPLTVVSDPKAALRTVLEERRREMAGVPTDRWFDLKRLNQDPEWAKAVVHELDGKTFTLEPGDPKWVMPVPLNVLEFNPDMPHTIR